MGIGRNVNRAEAANSGKGQSLTLEPPSTNSNDAFIQETPSIEEIMDCTGDDDNIGNSKLEKI